MTVATARHQVRTKVGPKGQIVIPKMFRDRLGIVPGSVVLLDLRPDEGLVTVESYSDGTVAGALDYFKRFRPTPGTESMSALDILHELDREEEDIWEHRYGPSSSTPSSSTHSRSSARSARRRPDPSSRPSSRPPGGTSSSSG
jgi:AbrB family looped-hinge helix DNA binding protein